MEDKVKTTGTIEHRHYENDENVEWKVTPACSKVRVVSTYMDTEPHYDFVYVDGTKYSGSMKIDQIVEGSFDVQFTSDGSSKNTGFTLVWQCLGKPLTC